MPKLPEKFEDWTAPWEVDGVEFTPEVAKKGLFNALKAQEKLKDSNTSLTADLAAKDTELTAANARLASKPGDEAAKDAKISELTAELTTLKTNGRPEDQATLLRQAAALEVGGLTAKDIKRLQGETLEELIDDAKELSARFAGPQGDQGDQQDPPPPGPPSRLPVPRNNGSAPGSVPFKTAEQIYKERTTPGGSIPSGIAPLTR